MCRIAGIISNQLSTAEISNRVQVMCNVLKHGGPDDEGIFLAVNVNMAFGHRRLSIIDLSRNGHQPMADTQKRAWITFNGEIYNYPDLKRELLKLGVQFHSESDTEVILTAYLHWGTAAFAMLRGMFAFALYDIDKAVTYLVRDSTGIKPLYYHAANRQLIFASEVKAIKAANPTIGPDQTWPVRFLALGHIPEPYTTLKDVFSLEKGHFLTWKHGENSFTIDSYINTQPVTGYITDIKTARQQIHDCCCSLCATTDLGLSGPPL